MVEQIETPNLTGTAIAGDAHGWQRGTVDGQNPADAAMARLNNSEIIGDPAAFFVMLLADAAEITTDQAKALVIEARTAGGPGAAWWDHLRANWPPTLQG